MENNDFISWAIVEITGYKKLAGKVKSEFSVEVAIAFTKK